MNSVDFSPGQAGIIRDIANIYNKSLKNNMDDFYSNKPDSNLNKIIGDVRRGIPELDFDKLIPALENNFHEDFFKHHDLSRKPEILNSFDTLDLVIIKFIAKEFSEDHDWNDLELANLIIKIDLLIQLKEGNYES